MKFMQKNNLLLSSLMALGLMMTSHFALAGGEIGDHVNKLSENLKKYEEEVNWLIKKVDGIVTRYEKSGVEAANSGAVVDHWEAVDFHAAIESNYIQLYASIWQGLFGVKESVDNKLAIAMVRAEQDKLENALWQSLGAVKLAAQFQDKGLLAKVKLREGGPTNSVEALNEINTRLNRVVAKFAEKLVDESVNIVYDTYLNLFEGVEGELIALDADLVEDLEKDFNVTLPKAIKEKAGVDEVRVIVIAMEDKINKAKSLIEQKAKTKREVF